jgi:cell division protein FtsQ
MWNDARSMGTAANCLFAVAGMLIAYALLHHVVRLPVFALQGIEIRGDTQHITREQVQAVLDRELRGNFFTVDLVQAGSAFRKLPWVRQVSVHRVWPDRIEFVVEEHRPIARWDSTALVSAQGEVFEAAVNSTLPVFYAPKDAAPDVVARYREFDGMLSQIGRRVVQIRVSARRAWQLKLDDGMVLELGRDAIDLRLASFVEAYGRSIAGLQAAPAYVDLRYPNGFAVRQPAGSAADKV